MCGSVKMPRLVGTFGHGLEFAVMLDFSLSMFQAQPELGLSPLMHDFLGGYSHIIAKKNMLNISS